MSALLSPLQLQAGAALLQNQGLSVPANLTTAISSYNSLALIQPLLTAIANASGVIANSTIANLQTIASASNSCPALADSIPADFIVSVGNTVVTDFTVASPTTSNAGLSGIISMTANTYLGDGDNSIFAQVLSTAYGYITTTNVFINSAINAQTYLGDTFVGMDSLVTGELTSVNLDTQAFGNDLKNLGYLIDLGNLKNYGTPLALIQQTVKLGGLVGPLVVALSLFGVPDTTIYSLRNPTLRVSDSIQKTMYQAMTLIKGDDLTQILQILGVTTPNIATMADLLDPTKIFPNSYGTLTAPTCSGLRGIYIVQDNFIGANSKLATELPATAPAVSYLRLSRIIPEDPALADRALAISLQQITNIATVTLPQLAAAYLAVETNKDLPDINAQLSAVPQAAIDYYLDTMASGSGENGTLLLTDVIGTSVGTVHIGNLDSTVATIDSLDSAGDLTDLTNIYTIILDIVDGTYGYANVSGLPAGPWTAGEPYATANSAIDTGMIPAAQTEIGNIITNNSSATANLNTYFNNMGTQLQKEAQYQAACSLDIPQLTGGIAATTQSLVFALPSYGKDTSVGGTAQYLEDLADISTSEGQSIVACLREGRTQDALKSAGIGSANSVKSTPKTPPPQANLIPSQYSASQAQSQIIT